MRREYWKNRLIEEALTNNYAGVVLTYPLLVLAVNRALFTVISRRRNPGTIRMWSDLRLIA